MSARLSKAARKRALLRIIEAKHRDGMSNTRIARVLTDALGERVKPRDVAGVAELAEHELGGAPRPRRRAG